MANLGQAYDPTNGERSTGSAPIPVAEYVLAAVKSDYVPAKSGNGMVAEYEFEVYEGDHKGRRVWARYNLENASAKAVEIAWREYNALKHACGRLNISDTSDLHGIPFRAYVGAVRDNPDRREIKSYKPLNGAPAGHASQTASPGAGTANAPWKRAAG